MRMISFQNMKLSKLVNLLRDENLDLRGQILDQKTDYVILNDSYKQFIEVSTHNTQTCCSAL